MSDYGLAPGYKWTQYRPDDPHDVFLANKGKWQTPAQPRRVQPPKVKPETLALLRPIPPPTKEFKLPASAPALVTWEWVAQCVGVSRSQAFSVYAKRKGPQLGNIAALIKKFGRPPKRKHGSKVAAGICASCNQPRVTAKHCRKHADEAAARSRAYHWAHRKEILARWARERQAERDAKLRRAA